MKKIRTIGGASVLAVLLLVLLFGVLARQPVSASAASYDDIVPDFTVSKYDVRMEIGRDRTIDVEEDISVEFRYSRNGIIRDLPLDSGVRYADFSVSIDGVGVENEFHTDDSSLLSLYMRGTERLEFGSSHVFSLSYRMIVPALQEEGYLPLDILGADWQTYISNFTAEIVCPDVPDIRLVANRGDAAWSREGNTITVTREEKLYGEGITLELKFGAGVLTPPPADLTPLWAALIALGVVALMVTVKLLFFRQPVLIRPVGLEAPEGMDPLRMGRIIDNKVDSEDLGALVFWLAAEGYLTIDMTDEDDPVLIRTQKELPPDMPRHVRLFYEGLFGTRTSVKSSSLNCSFYTTAAAVTGAVSGADGALFRPAGNVAIVLFGLLCVLSLGFFSLLYVLSFVGGGYYFWNVLPIALVSYAFAAAGAVSGARLRYKKGRAVSVLIALGFFLLSLLPALFCFVPCPAFSPWTVAVSAFGASVSGLCGGMFCVRTQTYNELLGKVVGFKDFIRYTEKDRIAFMVKDDPELYYHILPYAQVCGVTDVWTEKFSGLETAPPVWLTYSASDTLFDLMVWNSLFRRINVNLTRSFVSRPVNTGGGYHGGGFGGGSVGGGFGGGGGRSF